MLGDQLQRYYSRRKTKQPVKRGEVRRRVGNVCQEFRNSNPLYLIMDKML